MARNIDPQKIGVRTCAVHAGEAPDPATGASSPNIVMSSTYVTEQPEGFSAYELNAESPFVYTRWANPTVRQLESKLAALETAESAACYGSGVAAGAAILLSTLSAGDHLVLSDVCYAGIAELARDTLPRMNIDVTCVDTSNVDAVASSITPKTKMLFVDTPCNPLLKLTDISAMAKIAHRSGALLAVDNTFATPIGTKPLALGADFVMHSLTKYIGGHGDAVGGAVLGSTERIQAIVSEATVHHGGVLSPFNAWLIARGAATLPIRMQAHEQTAMAVAEFLESHPSVQRVLYPGLESHPQHELAKSQMANFSGMLTFQICGDKAAGDALAKRMAEQLQIFHYAVSLGHTRSLICWMPTESMLGNSFRLTGNAADDYRDWAGEGIFRISVGLEDAQDLCDDLAHVLESK